MKNMSSLFVRLSLESVVTSLTVNEFAINLIVSSHNSLSARFTTDSV